MHKKETNEQTMNDCEALHPPGRMNDNVDDEYDHGWWCDGRGSEGSTKCCEKISEAEYAMEFVSRMKKEEIICIGVRASLFVRDKKWVMTVGNLPL